MQSRAFCCLPCALHPGWNHESPVKCLHGAHSSNLGCSVSCAPGVVRRKAVKKHEVKTGVTESSSLCAHALLSAEADLQPLCSHSRGSTGVQAQLFLLGGMRRSLHGRHGGRSSSS